MLSAQVYSSEPRLTSCKSELTCIRFAVTAGTHDLVVGPHFTVIVAVGMGTKIHTGVYLFLAAHWERECSSRSDLD